MLYTLEVCVLPACGTRLARRPAAHTQRKCVPPAPESGAPASLSALVCPMLQTPIATRFSLVTHPAGSPESLRDTRGMAVSWDLGFGCSSRMSS